MKRSNKKSSKRERWEMQQQAEQTGKIKQSMRERIADVVDVSRDIILDVPRIVFIGNRELTIENYEGIVEYSDSIIRISSNSDLIKITGKRLEIRTITQEMLFITGFIKSLEFVNS